jgi:regulator of protease activity HflC (stomatin/prohibitin superfamily)
MKFKSLFFALALAAFAMTGIGCTRVGPGHVGIEVSMAGSNRGVQDIPVCTGWVFYNPMGTNIIEYPTFVQTAVWTHNKTEGSPNNEEISFNSKDGLIFYADVNLSYNLSAAKVPSFYLKFLSKDIESFTHGIMRQVARDEFNNEAAKYTAEEIYGVKKEEFVSKVRERVNAHFKDYGITIESLGFIGAPRAPQSFVDAINGKLSAIQKAQQAENELQEATAQAKKQIATAKGEAESNQIKAASLSPAILESKRLDIQYVLASRWNGVSPTTLMGGTGSPLPTFDMNKK